LKEKILTRRQKRKLRTTRKNGIFLEEQIKKSKDSMKNAKPHKKAPEWKNFDFTFKKTDKTNEKPSQDKPNFIQPPKTPFEAMRMLFFGGIVMYL
jgi:hypothetical protein